MAESEEALQLKRRARRRLVGAIALVSFVVIILPLLLDKEPGPPAPLLDVQIPKQDAGGVSTRITPPAAQAPVAPTPQKMAEPEPAARPAPPAASAEAPAAAPTDAKPAAVTPSATAVAPAKAAAAESKAAAPPTKDKSDPERARAALQGEAWVVALDAFSDANNVKQLRARLSAAGVKSYTEPVKTSRGELTRVRAGPFGSKEAAEKARTKLAAMGLKPGAVVSR